METTEVTVEIAEEPGELQVEAENHINNSDSSDSGFSEMCAADGGKSEDEGEIVKIEIVTTETTHTAYICKDNNTTKNVQRTSRTLSQNDKIINGHWRQVNHSKETEV